MDWLFFTFLSAIARAVYGVMTKVLSNKAEGSVYSQAVFLPLCAGLMSVLVSPLVGGIDFSFRIESLVLIVLMILGQGIGNVLYFAAIKHLTSGTAQISFSSIIVFNTILSVIFLNLKLSLINFFGIILLITAVLLAIQSKFEFNKKGVGLMTLAAFLFSIFQLATSQLSLQLSAATYLVVSYFGASAVVFILKPKVIISDLKNSGGFFKLIKIPFLTAVPSLINFILAYYAYRLSPEPARVAILLTGQVVFAVLLSYFFLKEKQSLGRKLFASILVIISAFLIKA